MLMNQESKIYLYAHTVDMRKSINTLCLLISQTLGKNPCDGSLFLFRCKKGNKLKALYYETNAFTLWYRRLEKGKFIFPRNADGVIEMSQSHFNWLLASDKYALMDAMAFTAPTHFY